jgi:hypothetical protein
MSRWSGASSRPTRLAVELAAPRGKGERPIRKTAAPPEFTGALIPEGAPAMTSMPEAPRNRVSRIARSLGIGRLRAGSGPGARSLRWRSAVREAGRTSRIFGRLHLRGNEPQPGAMCLKVRGPSPLEETASRSIRADPWLAADSDLAVPCTRSTRCDDGLSASPDHAKNVSRARVDHDAHEAAAAANARDPPFTSRIHDSVHFDETSAPGDPYGFPL